LVLEQHDIAGGGTHQFNLKGYQFDSGLHYTVPWSVPIFALTCLKKPEDVCAFDLMGDEHGTVDKINLVQVGMQAARSNSHFCFEMKHKEAHLQRLREEFPAENEAIDRSHSNSSSRSFSSY